MNETGVARLEVITPPVPIDWGDGCSTALALGITDLDHEYTAAGLHNMTITGDFLLALRQQLSSSIPRADLELGRIYHGFGVDRLIH